MMQTTQIHDRHSGQKCPSRRQPADRSARTNHFDFKPRCKPRGSSATRWLLVFAFTAAWATAPAWAIEIGKSKIELIDGSQIEGSIESIDANGTIAGEGIPSGLKFSEILSIQTGRKSQSNVESEVLIYPVGGGKLKASRPSVTVEKTLFRSDVGPQELPLQSVRAIVWTNSPGVVAAMKEPSTENDKVVVQTADGERVVEGILEGIEEEQVQINYKGESRKIGLSKVKAIVTADLGLSKPSGSIASLNLVDGSQIVGVIAGLTDNMLQVRLDGDASVGLMTEAIVDISIASDRIL